MKKTIVASIVAVMCFSSAAFAGERGGNEGQGQGRGQLSGLAQQQAQSSESIAAAQNAGNAQNITFNSPAAPTDTTQHLVYSGSTDQNINYGGTQTIKNVPSMVSGALTSSNDTCMGSASGSIAVPGFGFGIGKTYVDDNCVMLKNSRELWNMGMRGAGLARMCMDDNNREALVITGFECPQTTRSKNEAAKKTAAAQ